MTEQKKVVFNISAPEIDQQKEREIAEAEAKLERINNILGSVQNGWGISLYRLEPGWAEGHLETKRIYNDDPIDLNYIAQTWGGEIIIAKVIDEHGKYISSTQIPFRSFPPRSWGKELTHPNYRYAQTEEQKKEPPPRDPINTLDGILSIVERLRPKEESRPRDHSLDLGIIELLLRHQVNAQSATSPLGAVEQFIQIADAMKGFKGLFGDSEPRADSDDMIGKIGGLLDTYLKIKQSSPDPKTPKIAPPSQMPMIGPVQRPQPNPLTVAPLPRSSLADELASMDPTSAAESVLIALDKMPEEKREQALRVFFNSLGVEEEEEPIDKPDEHVQNSSYNATGSSGHD